MAVAQVGPVALVDLRGNAVPTVDVTVYESDGTTLATIFGPDRSTPLANPVPNGVPDGAGGIDIAANLLFWAESGDYRIKVWYNSLLVWDGPLEAPVVELDAKLSDARTPLPHSASHKPGGSDPLTGYLTDIVPEDGIHVTGSGTLVHVEARPDNKVAVPLGNKSLPRWQAALADIVNKRFKGVWLGDSISVLSNIGGFSAPWRFERQLNRLTYTTDPGTRGTRFTDPGAGTIIPSFGTLAGTHSKNGTGGYCANLASGDVITLPGMMNSVRIVYGKGPNGGTINLYDGSTSGSVVASVNTYAATTSYSHILEHTFPGAPVQRTVSVEVSGGTATLVEQGSAINTLLTANSGNGTGLDLVVCGHSGLHTGHFTPTSYPGSITDFGDPSSHALDFIANFQPAIVINNLGYNDASTTVYKADQTALYAEIFALSPDTEILTVVPYGGVGNGKSDQWEAALEIAALWPDRIEVVSYRATMGDVHKDSNTQKTSWDGAHPNAYGKALQTAIVYATLSGDPFGTALSQAITVAGDTSVAWEGPTTGRHLGLSARSAVTLTGSRSLGLDDFGAVHTYSGSSNITLDLPVSTVYPLILNGYESAVTSFIQGGTGTITVTTSGLTLHGPSATGGKDQRLDVSYSAGLDMLAVLNGAPPPASGVVSVSAGTGIAVTGPTATPTISATGTSGLTGNGSPLGVVTPARAGLYYDDLDGTLGAWRWMSTGTNAASWRVITGDTGWYRAVDAETVWQVTAGQIQIRRTPDTIHLRFVNVTVSASVSAWWNPPSPWLPSVVMDLPPLYSLADAPALSRLTYAAPGYNAVRMDVGPTWCGIIAAHTAGPWPTTIPAGWTPA